MSHRNPRPSYYLPGRCATNSNGGRLSQSRPAYESPSSQRMPPSQSPRPSRVSGIIDLVSDEEMENAPAPAPAQAQARASANSSLMIDLTTPSPDPPSRSERASGGSLTSGNSPSMKKFVRPVSIPRTPSPDVSPLIQQPGAKIEDFPHSPIPQVEPQSSERAKRHSSLEAATVGGSINYSSWILSDKEDGDDDDEEEDDGAAEDEPAQAILASRRTPEVHSKKTPNRTISQADSHALSDSPLVRRMREAKHARKTSAIPRSNPRSGLSSSKVLAHADAVENSKAACPTIMKLVESLTSIGKTMETDHALTVRWLLADAREKAGNTKPRVVKFCSFASLKSIQLKGEQAVAEGCSVERFGHLVFTKANKPSEKIITYLAKHIRGSVKRVPKYNSHTNMRRNVLSPDDDKLKFIPYLGDTKKGDKQHKSLLKEIAENYDTIRSEAGKEAERAFTIRAYLIDHLQEFGLSLPMLEQAYIKWDLADGTGRLQIQPKDARLICETAEDFNGEPNDKIEANIVALEEAFESVFDLDLQTVMMPSTRVKEITDAAHEKDVGEGTPEKPTDRLGTFCNLMCAICGAIDCQTHADYSHTEIHWGKNSADGKAPGRTQYITLRHPLSMQCPDMMRRYNTRLVEQAGADAETDVQRRFRSKPCSARCYKTGTMSDSKFEWGPRDLAVVPEMLISFNNEDTRACHIALALAVPCCEVHHLLESIGVNIESARAEVLSTARPKKPDWYDNKGKKLKGEWSELTSAHLHQERSQAQPCAHEGPCTRKCPCSRHDILCERFCGCPDDCPRRFTGCACSSLGRACVSDSCICIQMNRECGPECISCGAVPRSNPTNRFNDELFTHGCQNVALQRGVSKKLVMGESQLDGVGFGLYIAEATFKGEYISEYGGEIISSREAERRGIIYDRKYLSFLFDLNEDWVIDAARLGNKTRFINHAAYERDGLNCEAKIVLVNGEHRIKFIALRDISVGEELLFNYGRKFAEKHGLSKKLPKATEHSKGNGEGKKGVLVGREALDALDGVSQKTRGGVAAAVGGSPLAGGGRGGGNKMRKTAPPVKAVAAREEESVESGGSDFIDAESAENASPRRRRRRKVGRYTR